MPLAGVRVTFGSCLWSGTMGELQMIAEGGGGGGGGGGKGEEGGEGRQ